MIPDEEVRRLRRIEAAARDVMIDDAGDFRDWPLEATIEGFDRLEALKSALGVAPRYGRELGAEHHTCHARGMHPRGVDGLCGCDCSWCSAWRSCWAGTVGCGVSLGEPWRCDGFLLCNGCSDA